MLVGHVIEGESILPQVRRLIDRFWMTSIFLGTASGGLVVIINYKFTQVLCLEWYENGPR